MHKNNFNQLNSLRGFFQPLESIFQLISSKLTDHRVSMRTQLLTNKPSLPIIISLLPFFFGLNEYFQTEYYSLQRKYFFNKNLPGLTSRSETVDWETFLLLNNKNLTDSILYWNNENLLIQNNNSPRRILTSTYNYKSTIFNHKINETYPIVYNRINLDTTLPDSLPFKIQSFNSVNIDGIKEPISLNTNYSNVPDISSVKIPQFFEKNTSVSTLIGIKNNNVIPPISEDIDLITKQSSRFNLEFLKFLDSINLSNLELISSIPSRTMSGYLYPDKKLLQFDNNLKLLTNDTLEIKLPFSFLTKKQIVDVNSTPPKFLIQTRNSDIDENSPFQFIYSGPTTVFDPQTGFDWKFANSSQQIDFRTWLTNMRMNKIQNRNPKNFFGIFDSPEYKTQTFSTTKNLNVENYWLQNLPIFNTGNFIKPLRQDFQSKDIVQFPYISTVNLNKLIGTSNMVLPLPILQSNVATLTSTNIHNNKNITFELEPTFLNKNVHTNFLQNTTAPLINEYTTDYLTSGVYKSIPSVFNPQKNTLFTTLWEPLTFRSWLVTAQIGFAFLVFKVLKALADNYGRELLVYLLDLVALLGFVDEDLKQEIEILMGQKEKGFRIISKTNQTFNNIGGIKHLIPEIIEIVWFLRNSGRDFSLSNIIPRGILLTGPPGTGKTLLVQAIAGEAEVPVIALSGSSLLEPGESGALKLELVFQEARQLAPCIVFIDEIDTLAQKREQVLQNPMGADEILESLSTKNQTEIKTENSGSDTGQQEMYKEKLRILMQFLVELDGVQGRSGVVVIGATNRPEILDPAVLRPGRFDRILELGLPNSQKRGEIFKLYSKNLGTDQEIDWDYFIGRTVGYSAADIASIMNQSTLCAILNTTNHTLETIEFGIDRTTTIGFEKPISLQKTNIEIIQLAYYQIGKLLISYLLTDYPEVLVTHLWPRRLNIRALQINKNLQTYFFQFAHRSQLEDRLVGCYAGKAAEVLFLENYSAEINLSDLGSEDIEFAQNLITLMIDHWYLYSKTITIQNNSKILNNFNEKEYFDQTDKQQSLNQLVLNSEINLELELEEFTNTFNRRETEHLVQQQSQTFFPSSVWQSQVATEFEFATRIFSDWYRIYLPDPQQIERNLEWIPPDEYYHTNSLLESINWNDEIENSKSFLTSSLMLQSYNKALQLLDNNREYLDLLVSKLLKEEILRKPDLNELLKNLQVSSNKNDSIEIFKSWGKKSNRKKRRSIKLK
jgi:ATP-dependent Zn protease